MRVHRLTALLAVLLLVGPAARAWAGRDDLQVLRDVTRQLAGYTQFTVFDSVEAEVTAGRVVLRGWVTVPYKRDDVLRRVARVDGVAAVEDAIAVLPESQADDALRYKVAKAIYGHDAFLPYAALASPPIRIVVDGGRVTLTGSVTSDVERDLARTLASGLGEVEVRDALRIDRPTRLAGGPTPPAS